MPSRTAQRRDASPKKRRRLRVSKIIAKVELVWDDGEELAPGPTLNPVEVSMPMLEGSPWRAQIEAQIPGLEAEAAKGTVIELPPPAG